MYKGSPFPKKNSASCNAEKMVGVLAKRYRITTVGHVEMGSPTRSSTSGIRSGIIGSVKKQKIVGTGV
jgi:hypothetical protein